MGRGRRWRRRVTPHRRWSGSPSVPRLGSGSPQSPDRGPEGALRDRVRTRSRTSPRLDRTCVAGQQYAWSGRLDEVAGDCCWPLLSTADDLRRSRCRSARPASTLSTMPSGRACWSSTAVACESPIRCWRLPRPSIRMHAAAGAPRGARGRGPRTTSFGPATWRSPRELRTRHSPPDLVEALVELGELEEAHRVTRRLRALSTQQEHPWGLASAKRCQGIVQLANEYRTEAVAALAEATEAYELLGLRLDAARSLLALGRAQRRHRKWGAARRSLEWAEAAFTGLGSPGWVDETRAELARVGARRPQPSGELTPPSAESRSWPGMGSPTRRSPGHSSCP